jgi:hypothetical protein
MVEAAYTHGLSGAHSVKVHCALPRLSGCANAGAVRHQERRQLVLQQRLTLCSWVSLTRPEFYVAKGSIAALSFDCWQQG